MGRKTAFTLYMLCRRALLFSSTTHAAFLPSHPLQQRIWTLRPSSTIPAGRLFEGREDADSSTDNARAQVAGLNSVTETTTTRQARVSCTTSNSIPTKVSPDRISLRPATKEDLDTIQRWDEYDHLQDEEKFGDAEYNDWNWEHELTRPKVGWRELLVAAYSNDVNQSVPVGMVQVIDPSREESMYWGDEGKNEAYMREFCQPCFRAIDIWIGEPEYLGKGIGTIMMHMALRDYCFAEPKVTAVLVDPMPANADAIRFYQNKCGFQPIGLRTFGPDECLVHKLNREEWGKWKQRIE